MTVNTAGFAAYKFGNIRIFLLRHHGRTGCKSVVQFDEAEFRAAPQAELLAQTAHVHHQRRRKAEELNDIVPVADGVHAVGIYAAEIELFRYKEAVNRESSTGNGTGAQWHDIRTFPHAEQAAEIALQHVKICQQVMCKGNRLCALQMGVTRH